MKSTLKNMVLCLLFITFGAALIVGVVYGLTKEPIAAAKKAKTTGALARVLQEFDNDPMQDTVSVVLDGLPIMVHTGKKGGEVTGYAVETMTRIGYSGEIRMMVGFLPDGTIYNIEIIQHNETPGLGSKIADPGNPLLLSFTGTSPSNLRMSLRKEGGGIDGITASTISSRAYIDAVQRAYTAFQTVARDGADLETSHIAAVLGEYDKVAASAGVDVDGSPAVVNVVQKNGATIGYAVQAETQNGFRGTIRLMVGFLPDGTINDIAVVEQNETPGFGAAIAELGNPLLMSFKGKKADGLKFALKTNGGDVDAISGSTVTSTAYMEAVKRAYQAWVSFKKEDQSHE